jgi:HEAT repeat protein
VREAAVEAIGALGSGLAVLLSIAALLADPEASVRVASVHALGRLGATLARPDLVRKHLDAVAKDASPSVLAARDQVLTALAS